MTRRREPRSGESGYNLVILMVLVTITSIAAAAAMPLWSTAMQREREEELIFRGWQYAEGIRLFQQRFGRLPVKLEELVEAEPRCVRQLWEDPITDSMNWGLVLATAPGQGGVNVGGQAPPGSPPPDGGPVGDAGDGAPVPTGPIVGVYSRSTDESIKTLFGKDRYSDWQFTVEGLRQAFPAMGPGGDPTAPRNRSGLPFPARWIGRPLPDASGSGTLPGSDLPTSTLPPSQGVGGGPGTRGSGG